MILSESYIVSSIRYCIENGRPMDPDHWGKTFWPHLSVKMRASEFARCHDLARDEIASEQAEQAEIETLRNREGVVDE